MRRCPMLVSQSGLNSKNNQARPAQGTPWWSASGVAPSTGFSVNLAYKCPPRTVPAHCQRGGESSCSYRFHGEIPQRVIKPLTPQG